MYEQVFHVFCNLGFSDILLTIYWCFNIEPYCFNICVYLNTPISRGNMQNHECWWLLSGGWPQKMHPGFIALPLQSFVSWSVSLVNQLTHCYTVPSFDNTSLDCFNLYILIHIYFPWKCSQVNGLGLYWWQVNTDPEKKLAAWQLSSTQLNSKVFISINIHCWSVQHRTETNTGLFAPLLLSSYT